MTEVVNVQTPQPRDLKTRWRELISPFAKRITPGLSAMLVSMRLATVLELLIAYLNILIGNGAGTGWDDGETVIVSKFIKKTDPMVIDVGGNRGLWTQAIQREKGSLGQWILVEPAHECCEIIRSLNLPNTELIESAVSDRIGSMMFYTPGKASGFASLHKRFDSFLEGVDFEQREVPVTTIDKIVEEREIECVDFIKIDTEGHDLWVLKGAHKSLMSGKIRALSFEFGAGNINSRTYFKDFWDLLSASGYHLWRISPGGKVIRIKVYYEDLEYFRGVSNYIATRAS